MDAIANRPGKPEWAQSRREKENAKRLAAGLKPRRRIYPWVILAVLVIGAIAFFVLGPSAPAPEPTAPVAAAVKQIMPSEMTVLAPVTLSRTVRVTGTLAPSEQWDVTAQSSGRVLSVAVRPGDAVKAGDVLVELDTENLSIQLAQQRATAEATRAQLVSAQQQLARTEQLAKSELTTPSALEQARSSVAALEANLAALENSVRSAELALANGRVRAPADGIVSARSVEPGQTVSPGTPLLTVVNLAVMEFQAAASVGSSALIAPEQQVVVTLTGLEGQEFGGKVVRVNPVAVAGTRTVPVYVEIDNADRLLRGGMFAAGQIVVSEKQDAIAVPKVAIREDGDGFYVLKVTDNTLVRQGVEIVAEWDRGRVVELSGLNVGDRIVTAPLVELKAGEAVELVEG